MEKVEGWMLVRVGCDRPDCPLMTFGFLGKRKEQEKEE